MPEKKRLSTVLSAAPAGQVAFGVLTGASAGQVAFGVLAGASARPMLMRLSQKTGDAPARLHRGAPTKHTPRRREADIPEVPAVLSPESSIESQKGSLLGCCRPRPELTGS